MFRKYTAVAALLATRAALGADDSVKYVGCYPAVTQTQTQTITITNGTPGSVTPPTGTAVAGADLVTVTETKYETRTQTLIQTVFVTQDSQVLPTSLSSSANATPGLFTSSAATTSLGSYIDPTSLSPSASTAPYENRVAEDVVSGSGATTTATVSASSTEPDTTTKIKSTSTTTVTIPFPSTSSAVVGGYNYNATSTALVGTAPAVSTTLAGSSTTLLDIASTLSTMTAYREKATSNPIPVDVTSTYGVDTKTSTATSTAAYGSTTPIINGRSNAIYFTNWGIYGANYQPANLPAEKITRVLYSFADISSNGTVISSDSYADLEKHYAGDSWNDSGKNAYGCIKQLYLQKKKHRHMKLLLSIGGWTYSSKFAPVATKPEGRAEFCSSALTLVKDWGFDGIDIDWEYPKNKVETQAYVDLVKECRKQFDAYAAKHANNYHFQITIASPAGPANISDLNLPAMDKYVDAWHLMAYDYAGAWDKTSGHQANVHMSKTNPTSTKFSTDTAVNLYLNHSISADKLVLGFPLYGRSFTGTDGPGKPYTGLGQGTLEKGIWLYKDLPRTGASEHYDANIMATWSYDNSTKEMVSYDNVRSAKEKTKWMLAKGLGGAVYWEASGDKNGTSSIVSTVAESMGDMDTSENLLSYPESVYDNIRNNLEEAK
ncbi:Endochitinase 1 [Ceratocystis fimbriata CBS 114723]|uniref:chitinase n=1 Tax=Ceratocystis fimbriata CBS 114723 TaxID=1035309 RepID=A0A2C5WY04_9PEZI|nr:Endochitinase 1 [Ceratocystis fimbriata CBS 114723]